MTRSDWNLFQFRDAVFQNLQVASVADAVYCRSEAHDFFALLLQLSFNVARIKQLRLEACSERLCGRQKALLGFVFIQAAYESFKTLELGTVSKELALLPRDFRGFFARKLVGAACSRARMCIRLRDSPVRSRTRR